MPLLIASNRPEMTTRLRQSLLKHGVEARNTPAISIDLLSQQIKTGLSTPELIFVVLPENSETALEQIRQTSRISQARIVAIGGTSDARQILATLEAGADRYLDESGDTAQQLSAILERFQSKPRQGRLIVVTSIGGGSGGSLVAANLAALLAREHDKCALFDLDERKGDQALLWNLTARHTLTELCQNVNTLDEKMFEQFLTRHASGVALLASASNLENTSQVTAAGVQRAIQLARASFPLIVADCPLQMTAVLETLEPGDLVLPVFRLDFTALCHLQRVLEFWEQRHVPMDRVQLIANQVGRLKELPVGRLQSVLGRELKAELPNDPTLLNLSVNCGNPTVLESPGSDFAQSLEKLAEELAPSGKVRETTPGWRGLWASLAAPVGWGAVKSYTTRAAL